MTSKLNNWVYFKKPLLGAVLSSAISGYLSYNYICIDKLKDVVVKVNDTTTNFSLTFAAFSITALALLSFVQNQEWFSKVAKTKYFGNFLNRFVWSSKFAIIILLLTIAVRMVEPFYTTLICSVVLSLLVFLSVFLALWVWRCIDDLLSLFRD